MSFNKFCVIVLIITVLKTSVINGQVAQQPPITQHTVPVVPPIVVDVPTSPEAAQPPVSSANIPNIKISITVDGIETDYKDQKLITIIINDPEKVNLNDEQRQTYEHQSFHQQPMFHQHEIPIQMFDNMNFMPYFQVFNQDEFFQQQQYQQPQTPNVVNPETHSNNDRDDDIID